MIRSQKSSIKQKVTIAIMGASVAVLLVTVAAFMTYDLVTFRRTMVQNLITQARTIADNSTAALAFRNEEDATHVLTSLRTDPHIAAAALYDAHGSLFVKYLAANSTAAVPASPQGPGHEFSESRLIMFQPVVEAGKPLGTVYLQSDLTALSERFQLYGMFSLLITASSLGVAFWLSTTLQKRITNPIIALVETAQTISQEHDYSLRALKLSDDELGLLTDAFNEMLERIQTSYAALRESEQRERERSKELAKLIQQTDAQARLFDATLSSIKDLAYTFDLEGNWIYANQPLLKIWGKSLKEITGKSSLELGYPPELAARLKHQVKEVVATRQPVSGETYYTDAAGVEDYHEYIFSPVLAADGTVTAVCGTTRLTTERKRAEELLRQNEALFSALIEEAPVGVYVINEQFQIQQINTRALPAFEKVEPKMGRTLTEVMHIQWGKEAGDELAAIFRHTLDTGEPYVSTGYSNVRADLGEEKTFEWQTRRVTLPNGSHGVVCYFNDITERIRSEQALMQAKTAAESASRAKDEFLAALSHELRTPLNPALLIASESADNHELPEEVRSHFETIRKNIELEARLIDDLLDLTRITMKKMVLNRNVTDVHRILVDALATVQADQLEKNILLEVSLDATPSLVVGDAIRLQQVFWNVLKNAVKFTPANGRIKVETAIGGDSQLLIKVTDTGIGMNADELARVFSAFAQGDHARTGSSHKFGGLGLGLAISKNLIELHSGKITAQSAGSGLGSSFLLELPLAKEIKATNETEQVPKPKTSVFLGKDSVQLSILLVEDHEITRTVLAQLLTRRNYKVVTADSITRARAIARQDKFDLLISDIGLPDGNGNDLMKELHENYGLKGIALTGYGMEEDIARGKAAGFVTHLTKPVLIQSLENALTMVKNAS
jgi:PAS domain S-box-containing protein